MQSKTNAKRYGFRFFPQGGRLIAACAAATLVGISGASAKDLTVAVGAAFSTLDPYDCPDVLTRICAKSIYEGLFTFDKNLKPVPELAESYEVSPDALVYTVKLKTGVKFHDGTDFNADAVKVNFDRFLNPDNHLNRYSAYSMIDKVEALDPATVRFTLKKPTAGFIGRLAATTPQMICPSFVEKYGKGKQLATRACGTGPYVFESFNPNDGLRVKKNLNYRVAGLPKLDSIHWVPVIENATRAAMLRTGEAQYVSPMPLEQIAQLKEDKSIVIQSMPSLMSRYLSINNRVKPFTDKRVREAINYAINKEALCKVAYAGYAVPMSGIIPPKLPTSLKMGPWPYDPKKARELLKEAGYPNGFETTLWSGYNNTTSQKVIQFLQQQLAQVGIRVTLRTLEAGQRVAMIESVQRPEDAKSKLYYIGWSTSSDTDWALRPIFESKNCPPVLANEGYYSNKKVDALLDEALTVTDEAGREAIYGDIQTTIWNDAPWAWLVFEDNTAACSTKLKDFYPTPDGGYDFYRAYLEN